MRCGQARYLDPKVAAAAIVAAPGGIVLVRRAQRDQAHGLWILPGGHVDRGEQVSRAAARETLEETGLTVDVRGLVGVYSYADNPVVLIVYACQARPGELKPGPEALELRVFRPESLPWDDFGYPSTGHALRDYLAAGWCGE